RHIVACLSPSNSVQSSATTISLRSPTTKRTHESNRRHSCTPVLLRSRSTCLVPCLASLLRTADSPRPIAWIDRLTACTTPRTPSAIESTRRGWTVSANSSSAKRSTLLGATRTFPANRASQHGELVPEQRNLREQRPAPAKEVRHGGGEQEHGFDHGRANVAPCPRDFSRIREVATTARLGVRGMRPRSTSRESRSN